MKCSLTVIAAGCALLFLQASCRSSLPNAEQLSMYQKEAERRAAEKIAALKAERAKGQITEEDYKFRVDQINDEIPRKANEMAWTRHDLVESQQRALGIPTGDTQMEPPRPSSGAGGGFYRPGGTNSSGGYGGSTGASSTGPIGSPTNNSRFGGL